MFICAKLAARSAPSFSLDLFVLLFCHFAISSWKKKLIKKHHQQCVDATLSQVANMLTNVTLIIEMNQSSALISFVADRNVFVFNVANSSAH